MKLKHLIPEDLERKFPLDGLKKKQAINYITKTYDIYNRFKGFFSDNAWQPINTLIGEIQKDNIPLEIQKTEYYKDTNGNPAGKIWTCEIPFINQNNRQDKLYVRITAAGAGSVKDPLDRYDITITIS